MGGACVAKKRRQMKSFLILLGIFIVGIIMLIAEITVTSDYMRSLPVSERPDDPALTFLVIIGLAIAALLVLTPLCLIDLSPNTQ